MKLNCIIVEDEPLARERVRGYVGKIPALHIAGEFESALEALDFLRRNPADILFLDVNLGEVSGIQMLESAHLSCEVIFTTAYPEYALKGYDLRVTDYLLKPFTFDRFLSAVNKAQENLLKKAPATEPEFLFIKTEYRLEKVMLRDILFIEGMGDYRRIHTAQKRIMTLQTFGEFEKEIPPSRLCRVHKSWMVAPAHIDSVERDRIRIGNAVIPISDTYRQAFLDTIQPRA